MERTIWKAVLEPADVQAISVPEGSELLCAREDHDQICDDGDECTDDACWRGCPYCIADEDVN